MMDNPMRKISIDKVTVNMGFGADEEALKRGREIIKQMTNKKCVATKCKIRQPTWGLRPGLEIGLKTTLRKADAEKFLKNAFIAKGNNLSTDNFDNCGNFGFGLKEHIELPGIRYDPKIGTRGFDILITVKRPGYRIAKRKKTAATLGKKHRITKDEGIQFVKEKFGVKIE
ncbi:MAG: 50S ribosomal protein L5 [Candidatus Diapherotrites archaeon CG08_land_8_20_14_0_20_34_12]|nr:MAG: 50S ribosomal protein L5 [Candidatus Diapherotrites archaeon CG08_land_8_20_14_0_20_34_12]